MHLFVFRSETIFFCAAGSAVLDMGRKHSIDREALLPEDVLQRPRVVGPRLSPPVEQEAMHFRTVYFPKEINKGVKRSPGSVVVDCFCVLRLPAATLTESSRCVERHDKRWGFRRAL